MKSLTILALCSIVTFSSFAAEMDFKRYESIITRQMFGQLPVGFDPTKPPSEVQKTNSRTQKELTKEQEDIRKNITLSMINVSPAGEIMVGFTDIGKPTGNGKSALAKSSTARNYYLKVGETQGGWTVKSVDAAAATVVMEKGGIEVEVPLREESGEDAAESVGESAGRKSGHKGLNKFGLSSGRQNGEGQSLKERRQQKREQRELDDAEKEKNRREKEEQEARDKAKAEAEREEQREQLLKMTSEIKALREISNAKSEKENAETSATSEE